MGLESGELKMAVRDRDVWRWLEPAEIDSSGRHERGRGGTKTRTCLNTSDYRNYKHTSKNTHPLDMKNS